MFSLEIKDLLETYLESSQVEPKIIIPFTKAWERLAAALAKKALGFSTTNHNIQGVIKMGRLRRIAEVLAKLEYPEDKGKTKPDWDTELSYILKGRGENIPVQIVCDVYVEDISTHQKFAFELKSPLPNSDITKVSKEKILKLYSMEPRLIDAAYFALPYNPYGSRENYSWGFPARWFDMRHDPVVLIGDEFWDKLGGIGTYQTFIEAVNELGIAYKERIYREFLQIEPPPKTNFKL